MWFRAVLFSLLVTAAVAKKNVNQSQYSQEDSDHSSPYSSEIPPNPRTVTPYGAFNGSWMETRKGRRFEAYRGIRYAEAPVGNLRFEVPKPIHHYNEEVDASEEGPKCPSMVTKENFKKFSEDCLRLNVYTPSSTSGNASLPVIVFIHPGGFYCETGRSDLAGPHHLLDRDLVLVTINYRLGSLGFLSTGDALAPGNNGLKDQVVALRWINENIRSFGGDRDCITIAGSNAGSTSVVLHMISPMSKGLFHRAIAMSGSPTMMAPSPREIRNVTVKQARLLDCPTNSSRVIIDCLRKKNWREIVDTLPGFFEFEHSPVTVWIPIVEQDFGQPRFLDIEPMDAIKEGKLHAVPLIVSQTEKELYWLAFNVLKNATLLEKFNADWDRLAPISFMLPAETNTRQLQRLKEFYLEGEDLADDWRSERGLGTLYGDAVIGFGVYRLTKLLARHFPKKVWYNEFRYVGEHSLYEDPVTKKPIGAMHVDETIFLFSSSRFPLITPASPDSGFVDTMTALWVNFARHGDPNPRADLPELASLSWPALTVDSWSYLLLDRQFSIQHHLDQNPRFELWDELYPIDYGQGSLIPLA